MTDVPDRIGRSESHQERFSTMRIHQESIDSSNPTTSAGSTVSSLLVDPPCAGVRLCLRRRHAQTIGGLLVSDRGRSADRLGAWQAEAGLERWNN